LSLICSPSDNSAVTPMNDISRFTPQIIQYNTGLHIRCSTVPCHGRIVILKMGHGSRLTEKFAVEFSAVLSGCFSAEGMPLIPWIGIYCDLRLLWKDC
jgi:hypothetical protein